MPNFLEIVLIFLRPHVVYCW